MATKRQPAHPSAEAALRRLDRERASYPARLQKLRRDAGLKLREIGTIFGTDEFGASKLESGNIQLTGVRVEILLALEEAFKKRPAAVVWGPRSGLTTGQRLARIFSSAYPEPSARATP